jgi:riboflavin-specific deaminase-like protein
VKVFSNLAVSLDGKIAQGSSPRKPLGTALDRKRMQEIRRLADAVLVGTKTLHVSRKAVEVPGHRLINVIVSESGKVDPDLPIWKQSRVIKILCVPRKVQALARRNCRDRALVLACGESKLDLTQVLKQLKMRGIQKLLVEGGGEVIGSFLRQRCLHEMYVTWTPWALGHGDSVSLTGSRELRPWSRFEILKAQRIKNEIYMHLKCRGARRV